MSRLEEECIMYVGRNRSGIDSGEIDYGVMVEKFDRMSTQDLEDAMRTLDVLKEKCREKIFQLIRESK